MKKIFGVIAFVVLAVLASAVPASAQAICWGCIPGDVLEDTYYVVRGDNVGLVTAQNRRLVRDLTGQLPRSLGPDLRWNGSVYGLPMSNDRFYPMYDRDRRPLSGRQRIERGAGIVVAADGVRRIINNPRGAAGWIEAAVGAVLVNDSRYRGQPKNNQRDNRTIVTPPPDSQPPVYWSNGAQVAVGTRPRGENVQSSLGIVNQSSGLIRRAVNRTGMEVAVFQTGADPSMEESLMVLTRGESFEVPLNNGGYDVYILVPTNRLGVQDVRRATVVPNHDLNGWDIVVAP